MAAVLWVGAGGFLGAVGRYLLGLVPFEGDFPLMTFLVNFAGAVAIGAITEGYRTECVSAPIIHCRCSAGMWNSLQTIPEPYSSGALSFRLRLLEADANNPST